MTKIILSANQTNDTELFIELDLINKLFNGYILSNNNEKIIETNINLNISSNKPISSKVFITLGAHENFGSGFIGEISVRGIRINDKMYNIPNDKIFSGDIALEEKCTQLDELKGKKIKMGECTYNERRKCLNNGICKINRNGEAECLCKIKDYVGKYCQFPLLPKMCSHIPHVNGVQKIDVDGSDMGEMAYVECLNGTTIISHNFPSNKIIRNQNITNSLTYDISYKLISNIQLKQLIERSGKCSQSLMYHCHGNTSSKLKQSLTWFESIFYDEPLPPYLSENDDDLDYYCSKKDKYQSLSYICRCNDQLHINSTEIFSDKINVGIKKVHVMTSSSNNNNNNINDVKGTLSISSLRCSGDIGYGNDYTLSFKSMEGNLWFHKPIARKIEFEYRSMTQNKSKLIEFIDKDNILNLQIKNSNEFEVNIKTKGIIISEKITTKNFLDDGKWRRIVLELNRHEFKISIDESFKIINNANFLSKIEEMLGKTLQIKVKNFIGCIRGLYIDDILINFKNEMKNINLDNISLGCPMLCENNNCQQRSKCVENLKENAYSCKCNNDKIHYGDKCQYNINNDSDISFLNSYESYVGYDSKRSLIINSIQEDITMSFRTDQKQALLLYLMDEMKNFIQIHLSDEFRIILSMNHGNISKQCTVFAPINSVFNDMKWKQIYFYYEDNNAILSVNDEICKIIGPHILTTTSVALEEVDDEIVIPPIVPGQLTILPYKVLYIGGVPKARGSGNLITWSPIYNTKIPSILGCIRGLKLGKISLNLRKPDLKPINNKVLKMKCNDDLCSNLECRNDGHCSVRWLTYQTPNLEETYCDCSKTSFYGALCEEADTIMFSDTDQQLYFDMSKIRKRYDLFESKSQSFKFSFSSEKQVNESNKILLSLIVMDDKNENIEILINSKGNLIIGINDENIIFSGNYTDGYRHYVQLYFNQDQRKIWLIVDEYRRYISNIKRMYSLSRAQRFVFGNIAETNESNYMGYISNIDVDYHKNEHVHFMPLSYYKDINSEYYTSVIVKSKNNVSLLTNYKSSFKIKNTISENQKNNLEFPKWEVPLTVSVINTPIKITPTPSLQEGDEYNYVILIIAIVVLILILLILLCIGCCCSKKRSNQRRPVSVGKLPPISSQNDTPKKNTYIPFNNINEPPLSSIPYHPGNNDYSLPEPEEDIEQIPPLEQLESFTSEEESNKYESEGNDDDPLISMTDYEEGRNSMIYIN
uniref:EGF-like domain-containing protein n=1 Tax=Parastrongyloides trichosuri TaxID=131310 RepID=A0A0N4ZEX6_PARTI